MVAVVGNYCPATGKECFNTKGDAQKAMRRLDKKGSKKGAVYQCPDCGKWHITHYGYNKSKDVRQNKIKNNMAGKGKFKIGAEVGFVDNLGSPLKCGDYVRHIITTKEGVISQYGVVKSEDGTNYKLCDNFWEVIESPFKAEEKNDELIDIEIKDELGNTVAEGQVKEESNDLAETFKKIEEEAQKGWKVTEDAETGEVKVEVFSEKTLMDFTDESIIREILSRKISKDAHMILLDSFSDQTLADELRRRGFELTAKKVVEICL